MRLISLVLILCILSAPLFADDLQWQRMGPPGGMVMTLEVSAAGGTIYLGTADGHIFASNDNAGHWELRGRVGSRMDTVISRLLADPSRPDVVFAAAWYQQPGAGGGIFRSEDAGRTWSFMGLAQEAVRALEVASTQPLVLVAGTRSGVFRSQNAGRSWERISPPGDPELRNVDSVAIDPKDSNVIYAGTYHLPWKTVNGGKNWNPVATGLIDDSDIMSLRVDATHPERLFLSACSGIYRSENKGAQWTKLQGIPYAARRTHSILQDPQSSQTLYAATTEGLWVTRDSGETWKRTTTRDWIVNSVIVLRSPTAGSARVVLGTEAQGVMVSDDAGESFTPSNEGFTHQVVREFISDPLDSHHLLMVIQKNGPQILESRDSGRTWKPLTTRLSPERGTPSQFSADSVDRLYGTPWGWLARLQSGQLLIFNEAAEIWREWKLQLPANAPTLPAQSGKRPARTTARNPVKTLAVEMPLAFSLSYSFVPTQAGLFRCDLEGNCYLLKAFAKLGKPAALRASLDGSMLTLVSGSKLAISHDGGQYASWRDIPVPATAVLWIDNTEESNMTTFFLGTTNGLYISNNEGATWTQQQSGLPAGQVEGWLRRTHLLIATLREGGIYTSSDDGTTWRRVDRDAERGRAVGLVETTPGTVAIGSQSEGVLIWQIP